MEAIHTTRFTIITALVLVGYVGVLTLQYQEAHSEQLKILETQLNKHSITGVLQNPYDYPISGIVVQAEFYDKEGNLVGVRDVGQSTKDELEPGEKSPYKIPDIGKSFPKTDFSVSAEGIDSTNMVEVSSDELIGQIEDLGRALKNLPDEVIINVIENQSNQNVSNQNLSTQDLNLTGAQ